MYKISSREQVLCIQSELNKTKKKKISQKKQQLTPKMTEPVNQTVTIYLLNDIVTQSHILFVARGVNTEREYSS